MENLYLYETKSIGNKWVVVNSQTGNRVSKYLDQKTADKLAVFLTEFIPKLVQKMN
jgi:hypothetical protein